MNFLRSAFISLLIPALIISNIYVFKDMFDQGVSLSLVGAAIVSLPFLLFFVKAMTLQNMPRTSKNLTFIIFSICLGIFIVAISFVTNQGNQEQLMLSAIVAVSNGLLFLIYITWYSKLTRNTSNDLSIGKVLPEFSLYQSEQLVHSKDLLGKPTVIMFYRGNWCPFCVAQIKELVSAYKKAIYNGVQFVLVSPQPDKNTEDLAKKFEVPFMFLRDKDNAAAKILGLFHKNGLPTGLQALGYDSDTVLPTVIVTDEKGIVTYLSLTDNYRVRPEANDFLDHILLTNEQK